MDRRCIVPGCTRPFYARGFCDSHYGLARKYPDETPGQLALRRKRARTPDELLAHIVGRCVRVGECLEWQGFRDHAGYGSVRWAGRSWPVHRLVYTLAVEEVARGVEVCHRCDNPPCIALPHLFAGSHHDNMLDARAKGRMVGNGGRSGELNGRAHLTEADVRAIRASTERQVDLAAQYGVTQPTISAIRLRKCWAHLPD
jgi:hypothetical protein